MAAAQRTHPWFRYGFCVRAWIGVAQTDNSPIATPYMANATLRLDASRNATPNGIASAMPPAAMRMCQRRSFWDNWSATIPEPNGAYQEADCRCGAKLRANLASCDTMYPQKKRCCP